MNEFREVIEKRRKLLIQISVFILVLNGVLIYLNNQYSLSNQRVEAVIHFVSGLIIGFCFVAILGVYKYNRSLRNDNNLKQLYISEHDERNILIKQKMAKSVLFTGVVILIMTISIAVYLEPIVAFTLIGVLFGVLILVLIFKVYYSHRY